MNEDLEKQNLDKNLYQGNYDNDYQESVKASTVVVDDNLSNHNNKEESPKYMNLGAPRERDEEDYAHHENNMRSLFGEDSSVSFSSLGFTPKNRGSFVTVPKKTGTNVVARFFARYFNVYLSGKNFKLVKSSVVESTTVSSQIKWGVMVIFLAVSASSFLTESTLYVKDFFFGGNNMVAINNDTFSPHTSSSTNNQKGSDDGTNANGSSTGQKIGGVSKYRLNDISHFPILSAKSFLVADLATGETIKESQDVGQYPLASVSKLMTGLIAYQQMDPKTMAVVSRNSYSTFGSEGELLLGESIRVSDLMYPLLMESSNDGAEVLADTFGHDKFMSEMNKEAKILGMNDTYYNDPSGLDPKNVSTVDDQFKLAKYIYENAPVVFDLTRVRQFEILKHRWYSKNAMLNIDSFIGGKNGFIDESRQTTTCLFDVQMAKGGRRKIAIMLLKTNDREGDVVKILSFLKKNGYYEEDWLGDSRP